MTWPPWARSISRTGPASTLPGRPLHLLRWGLLGPPGAGWGVLVAAFTAPMHRTAGSSGKPGWGLVPLGTEAGDRLPGPSGDWGTNTSSFGLRLPLGHTLRSRGISTRPLPRRPRPTKSSSQWVFLFNLSPDLSSVGDETKSMGHDQC